MAMVFLNYEQDIKDPGEFAGEAPKVESSPQELKLAKTLVTSLATDDFDFDQYRDDYTDRLRKLIEAKVEGKQVVVPPAVEEGPSATNLMEALQKSLERAKKAATGKPAKMQAPSALAPPARQQQQRRRKSS
jgi:DNA end-binding protein Ku